MIDNEIKAKFVLYRAECLTYDEISNLLNVSRPTLIKWNRELDEYIYLAKVKLMEELVGKIFEENKDRILNQFQILDRAANPDKGQKTEVEKLKRKTAKKLGNLFGVRVYSITFSFGRDDELDKVIIDCK